MHAFHWHSVVLSAGAADGQSDARIDQAGIFIRHSEMNPPPKYPGWDHILGGRMCLHGD